MFAAPRQDVQFIICLARVDRETVGVSYETRYSIALGALILAPASIDWTHVRDDCWVQQ